MTINLTLKDLTKDCAAGTGMAVYIWHCDRDGDYSLYSQDAIEQNYLRGVQVADSTAACSSLRSFPPVTPAGGRTSTSRSSTLSNRPSPAITRD